MNKIAIFIPTYKRPQVLRELTINIEQNTNSSFEIYFGLEADDKAGQEAALDTGHKMIVNKYEPGYSNTIQTLYEASEEPYILHGNDDFVFHKNWDEVPLSMFTGKIMVVGLRQAESDNHGSAISLFKREYIKQMSGVVDMPGRVFYPYNHNYVDTEFTQTAQSRGVWAKCDTQVITHAHPGFTGAQKDDTYRKNDESAHLDSKTFESRKHLW